MSKPLAGLLMAVVAASEAVPAHGQSFNRHSASFSVGVARPRGELRPWFTDSPLVTAEYGFRFHRNFQLDAGFDTAFGAADIRDWLPTQFGDLRIRDHQYMIPFGGRVILPLANEKVHIYGGLGAAYFRYSESLQQPFQDSDFRIPCAVCSSRDGFGYYSIVGATVALDRDRHFRVGVGGRVYRGHTSGDALGAAPPRETTDRWVNLFGSFSVTF